MVFTEASEQYNDYSMGVTACNRRVKGKYERMAQVVRPGLKVISDHGIIVAIRNVKQFLPEIKNGFRPCFIDNTG